MCWFLQNSLFHLINCQPDIDKIYIDALKIHVKEKIIFLINKGESTELKHFNDSKGFIEYLLDVNDVCKNIEEYYPNKKQKILIVFDNMIVDMLSDKKLNTVLTELFIRDRKLNISGGFYYTILFCCLKKFYENYYVIMKIPNNSEL